MPLPRQHIPTAHCIPPESIEHIIPCEQATDSSQGSPIHLMGHSQLVPGYIVVRDENYPQHVLLFIRKGILQYRLSKEGDDHEVSAGNMVFFPAHTWYIYGSDTQLEVSWCHLQPMASEWNFLLGVRQFVVPADTSMNIIDVLIGVLYNELHIPQRGEYSHSIVWDTRQLLQHCLQNKLHQLVTEPPEYQTLHRLFQKIENSLSHHWNVKEMAQFCNCSESTLFSLVQHCYHCSPMKYLLRLRMLAAANLLAHSNNILDNIALMVGLGCGFSLSRVFKKYYGISPKEYRLKHQ